jgi:hypothetical protein
MRRRLRGVPCSRASSTGASHRSSELIPRHPRFMPTTSVLPPEGRPLLDGAPRAGGGWRGVSRRSGSPPRPGASRQGGRSRPGEAGTGRPQLRPRRWHRGGGVIVPMRYALPLAANPRCRSWGYNARRSPRCHWHSCRLTLTSLAQRVVPFIAHLPDGESPRKSPSDRDRFVTGVPARRQLSGRPPRSLH